MTLFVGQNKGKAERNASGSCARRPGQFRAGDVDRAFRENRASQVGKKNVGATRVAGRGLFEGDPEGSLAYEVAFVPNEREKTWDQFRQNMDSLAEVLGERFCQDEVLIVRDDGKKRTVAAARWEPEDD